MNPQNLIVFVLLCIAGEGFVGELQQQYICDQYSPLYDHLSSEISSNISMTS
jgi:hypothetical protein